MSLWLISFTGERHDTNLSSRSTGRLPRCGSEALSHFEARHFERATYADISWAAPAGIYGAAGASHKRDGAYDNASSFLFIVK